MAKIHFYLKNPNNKESLIVKQLNFKRKRFRTTTGDVIDVKAWDKRFERPRRGYDYRKWEPLSRKLDEIEDEFTKGYRRLSYDNRVTPELVEQLFRQGESKDTPKTVLGFFQYIIDEYNSLGRATGPLNNTLNRLKKRYPYNLNFKDITIDWYNQYISWAQNTTYPYKDEKRHYAKNTIGKDIKNIKTVLNQAKLRGITDIEVQKNPYFKSFSEDVYYTYLTMEEIEQLHNFDFSKHKYIDQHSVDWWLILALTGMRVGDGTRLTKENLSGDGFFVQDMQKVSGRVVVPLHRIVKEIIAKHDEGLPDLRSEQWINRNIKKACMIAGINSQVVSTRTEGGKKVTKKCEKWQVVTTHTGRRSLATNMYLAGFPLEVIRLLTGHSNSNQLLKYIKVTAEEAVRSIKDHDFWK